MIFALPVKDEKKKKTKESTNTMIRNLHNANSCSLIAKTCLTFSHRQFVISSNAICSVCTASLVQTNRYGGFLVKPVDIGMPRYVMPIENRHV